MAHCTPLGIEAISGSSETLRAPRRRRPFRVGIDGRSKGFCEITRSVVRRRRTGISRTEVDVASVPLTRAGASHLDERAMRASC